MIWILVVSLGAGVGRTPVSLAKILSQNLHDLPAVSAELVKKAGGFSWSCVSAATVAPAIFQRGR